MVPARSPPAYATIDGVAVDSLHNDVLRGATLAIDNVSTLAFSDSLGRFHIDSVPIGTRIIRVIHPILDSMGIDLHTPPLQFAAGQTFNVVVGIPSAKTLIAKTCSREDRRLGPAALLGTVQFDASNAPAAGAQVILQWIEVYVVGRKIQSDPVRRTVVVGQTGRFQLCGLPEDLGGTLIAVNGRDSTDIVDVELDSPLGVVGLSLPDPEPRGALATTASRRATAVLTGRVVDPQGAPIARARVAANGDSVAVLSDVDGRFTLQNLRGGTRAISVRRLGFEPTSVGVSLHAQRTVDITIKLARFVTMLDTVVVIARRNYALERTGFTRRKQAGTGYYLTPEQITRQHAYELTSLLSTAPMLRRSYVNGRPVITGRPRGIGGGCVDWVIDGMPWPADAVDEFIWPDEVAAIEVYSNAFAPAEFRRTLDNCEMVVLWTKMTVH
ncbi:MAG TPA: carboxypeptidase regulatory-like domain-containing protein [Gemmatimonadaceae bacterium]|nr:carboxypeptidase regulatory-like domain-containing protein [Gemmatimonadaceae bacterium]